MVAKCEALYGYARFVEKVRGNIKTGLELTAAITKAVKDCVDEDILADFLLTHSSEVINVFTTEWDYEKEKIVLRQEALEEGIEKGLEKGREEGMDISAEIMRALIEKVPLEEIADRYHTPMDKIMQFQSILALR